MLDRGRYTTTTTGSSPRRQVMFIGPAHECVGTAQGYGHTTVDVTEVHRGPFRGSNPVTSIMLQWHRIHVAVVLSSVLEQE